MARYLINSKEQGRVTKYASGVTRHRYAGRGRASGCRYVRRGWMELGCQPVPAPSQRRRGGAAAPRRRHGASLLARRWPLLARRWAHRKGRSSICLGIRDLSAAPPRRRPLPAANWPPPYNTPRRRRAASSASRPPPSTPAQAHCWYRGQLGDFPPMEDTNWLEHLSVELAFIFILSWHGIAEHEQRH